MNAAGRWLSGAAGAAGAAVYGFILAVGSAAISPLAALAAGIGLIAGVLMLVFPAFALGVTTFVIPLERLGRFGDDASLQSFSAMRLIGLATLASVGIHMLRNRLAPVIEPVTLTYGAFCLFGFVSILYAMDPEATRAHAATNLGNLLMVIVLLNGVRDFALLKRLVLAWLAATILVGLYQLYDWHFGTPLSDLDYSKAAGRFSTTIVSLSESESLGGAKRAMGTTSNPAVYGVNLLLALPFFFYFLKMARGRAAQLFWLLASLLVLYNLLLTNTRTVTVFMIILLFVFAVTGLVRVGGRLIAAGLVALPIMLLLTPANIYERALSFDAYSLDRASNLTGRFDLWLAALRLGSEHLLTGIGVGNRTEILNYLPLVEREAEWIMAHNEFLQVFVELGLPGLLLFAGFCLLVVRKGLGAMRRARLLGDEDQRWFLLAAVIAVLTGIAFAQQADAFHFPLKGWWLAAASIAILARLAAERRRGEEARESPAADKARDWGLRPSTS
jgi:O-antigen ligase